MYGCVVNPLLYKPLLDDPQERAYKSGLKLREKVLLESKEDDIRVCVCCFY